SRGVKLVHDLQVLFARGQESLANLRPAGAKLQGLLPAACPGLIWRTAQHIRVQPGHKGSCIAMGGLVFRRSQEAESHLRLINAGHEVLHPESTSAGVRSAVE